MKSGGTTLPGSRVNSQSQRGRGYSGARQNENKKKIIEITILGKLLLFPIKSCESYSTSVNLSFFSK